MKRWEKYNGYWRKLLNHDWFSIMDDWGCENDDKYRVDIRIYRTFSLHDGLGYQITAPDIAINDKNLFSVIGQFHRHLYRGGTPCYYRLKEILYDKNMWKDVN